MSKQAKPPPPGDKPAPSAPPPPPTWRNWLWPIMLIVIFALFFLLPTRSPSTSLTYSQFLHDVSAHQVKTVQLASTPGGTSSGTLTNGKNFTVVVPPQAGQQLLTELQDNNVTVSSAPSGNGFGTEVLIYVITFGLPILIFVWLFRRISRGAAGGLQGALGVGRSRAKVFDEEQPKTKFSDVAGYEGAKAEIAEVVDFLKMPERYSRVGAIVPRGVLMVGPPGTGKTLLARAVAGEAGVPFFSVTGSGFVELFVGVGASRVRDLFEQARKRAPAIIFIDELDALGRARGAYGLGGHDEKEQTLNQLLVEMDGFDTSEGLILIAATNRPEILDPALLRAGRFDRQVLVDRPDKLGRVQILRVHLKKVQLASDVDPEKIAALTPGFTGADLANLVNEATLFATRRGADAVSLADFTAAVERIVAGLEKKSRILNAKEREIVAHHEMGHALVALALPGTDPVHKVSIIPRGIGALGYTIQRPTEDRFLMTREELEHKMAVSLGGRAAELIVFGHLSTGAADDLRRVTDIARSMVTRHGMVQGMGHVAYEEERAPFLGGPLPQGHREYSEDTAREIDRAVREIVRSALDRALTILKRHRRVLEDAAKELLQKETLAEPDVAAISRRLSLDVSREAVGSNA